MGRAHFAGLSASNAGHDAASGLFSGAGAAGGFDFGGAGDALGLQASVLSAASGLGGVALGWPGSPAIGSGGSGGGAVIYHHGGMTNGASSPGGSSAAAAGDGALGLQLSHAHSHAQSHSQSMVLAAEKAARAVHQHATGGAAALGSPTADINTARGAHGGRPLSAGGSSVVSARRRAGGVAAAGAAAASASSATVTAASTAAGGSTARSQVAGFPASTASNGAGFLEIVGSTPSHAGAGASSPGAAASGAIPAAKGAAAWEQHLLPPSASTHALPSAGVGGAAASAMRSRNASVAQAGGAPSAQHAAASGAAAVDGIAPGREGRPRLSWAPGTVQPSGKPPSRQRSPGAGAGDGDGDGDASTSIGASSAASAAAASAFGPPRGRGARGSGVSGVVAGDPGTPTAFSVRTAGTGGGFSASDSAGGPGAGGFVQAAFLRSAGNNGITRPGTGTFGGAVNDGGFGLGAATAGDAPGSPVVAAAAAAAAAAALADVGSWASVPGVGLHGARGHAGAGASAASGADAAGKQRRQVKPLGGHAAGQNKAASAAERAAAAAVAGAGAGQLGDYGSQALDDEAAGAAEDGPLIEHHEHQQQHGQLGPDEPSIVMMPRPIKAANPQDLFLTGTRFGPQGETALPAWARGGSSAAAAAFSSHPFRNVIRGSNRQGSSWGPSGGGAATAAATGHHASKAGTAAAAAGADALDGAADPLAGAGGLTLTLAGALSACRALRPDEVVHLDLAEEDVVAVEPAGLESLVRCDRVDLSANLLGWAPAVPPQQHQQQQHGDGAGAGDGGNAMDDATAAAAAAVSAALRERTASMEEAGSAWLMQDPLEAPASAADPFNLLLGGAVPLLGPGGLPVGGPHGSPYGGSVLLSADGSLDSLDTFGGSPQGSAAAAAAAAQLASMLRMRGGRSLLALGVLPSLAELYVACNGIGPVPAVPEWSRAQSLDHMPLLIARNAAVAAAKRRARRLRRQHRLRDHIEASVAQGSAGLSAAASAIDSVAADLAAAGGLAGSVPQFDSSAHAGIDGDAVGDGSRPRLGSAGAAPAGSVSASVTDVFSERAPGVVSNLGALAQSVAGAPALTSVTSGLTPRLFPALAVLDLSHNRLPPDALGTILLCCSPTMRGLDISHNGLRSLPDALSRCLGLEVLHASGNALGDGCTLFQLSLLPRLRELSLDGNRFAGIPSFAVGAVTLPTVQARAVYEIATSGPRRKRDMGPSWAVAARGDDEASVLLMSATSCGDLLPLLSAALMSDTDRERALVAPFAPLHLPGRVLEQLANQGEQGYDVRHVVSEEAGEERLVRAPLHRSIVPPTHMPVSLQQLADECVLALPPQATGDDDEFAGPGTGDSAFGIRKMPAAMRLVVPDMHFPALQRLNLSRNPLDARDPSLPVALALMPRLRWLGLWELPPPASSSGGTQTPAAEGSPARAFDAFQGAQPAVPPGFRFKRRRITLQLVQPAADDLKGWGIKVDVRKPAPVAGAGGGDGELADTAELLGMGMRGRRGSAADGDGGSDSGGSSGADSDSDGGASDGGASVAGGGRGGGGASVAGSDLDGPSRSASVVASELPGQRSFPWGPDLAAGRSELWLGPDDEDDTVNVSGGGAGTGGIAAAASAVGGLLSLVAAASASGNGSQAMLAAVMGRRPRKQPPPVPDTDSGASTVGGFGGSRAPNGIPSWNRMSPQHAVDGRRPGSNAGLGPAANATAAVEAKPAPPAGPPVRADLAREIAALSAAATAAAMALGLPLKGVKHRGHGGTAAAADEAMTGAIDANGQPSVASLGSLHAFASNTTASAAVVPGAIGAMQIAASTVTKALASLDAAGAAAYLASLGMSVDTRSRPSGLSGDPGGSVGQTGGSTASIAAAIGAASTSSTSARSTSRSAGGAAAIPAAMSPGRVPPLRLQQQAADSAAAGFSVSSRGGGPGSAVAASARPSQSEAILKTALESALSTTSSRAFGNLASSAGNGVVYAGEADGQGSYDGGGAEGKHTDGDYAGVDDERGDGDDGGAAAAEEYQVPLVVPLGALPLTRKGAGIVSAPPLSFFRKAHATAAAGLPIPGLPGAGGDGVNSGAAHSQLSRSGGGLSGPFNGIGTSSTRGSLQHPLVVAGRRGHGSLAGGGSGRASVASASGLSVASSSGVSAMSKGAAAVFEDPLAAVAMQNVRERAARAAASAAADSATAVRTLSRQQQPQQTTASQGRSLLPPATPLHAGGDGHSHYHLHHDDGGDASQFTGVDSHGSFHHDGYEADGAVGTTGYYGATAAPRATRAQPLSLLGASSPIPLAAVAATAKALRHLVDAQVSDSRAAAVALPLRPPAVPSGPGSPASPASSPSKTGSSGAGGAGAGKTSPGKGRAAPTSTPVPLMTLQWAVRGPPGRAVTLQQPFDTAFNALVDAHPAGVNTLTTAAAISATAAASVAAGTPSFIVSVTQLPGVLERAKAQHSMLATLGVKGKGGKDGRARSPSRGGVSGGGSTDDAALASLAKRGRRTSVTTLLETEAVAAAAAEARRRAALVVHADVSVSEGGTEELEPRTATEAAAAAARALARRARQSEAGSSSAGPFGSMASSIDGGGSLGSGFPGSDDGKDNRTGKAKGKGKGRAVVPFYIAAAEAAEAAALRRAKNALISSQYPLGTVPHPSPAAHALFDAAQGAALAALVANRRLQAVDGGLGTLAEELAPGLDVLDDADTLLAAARARSAVVDPSAVGAAEAPSIISGSASFPSIAPGASIIGAGAAGGKAQQQKQQDDEERQPARRRLRGAITVQHMEATAASLGAPAGFTTALQEMASGSGADFAAALDAGTLPSAGAAGGGSGGSFGVTLPHGAASASHADLHELALSMSPGAGAGNDGAGSSSRFYGGKHGSSSGRMHALHSSASPMQPSAASMPTGGVYASKVFGPMAAVEAAAAILEAASSGGGAVGGGGGGMRGRAGGGGTAALLTPGASIALSGSIGNPSRLAAAGAATLGGGGGGGSHSILSGNGSGSVAAPPMSPLRAAPGRLLPRTLATPTGAAGGEGDIVSLLRAKRAGDAKEEAALLASVVGALAKVAATV